MRADRRTLALAVALAALAVAFFGLRPKATPTVGFRDFESYWSAGRAVADGVDPYGRGIWRYQQTIAGVVPGRDELLPFVGPPYGLPLWTLLARAPFGVAIWYWGAALAIALGTIAIGSLTLAGRRIDAPDLVAMGVLCACFGPLTSGMGLGQVAVVAVAATIAAVAFARRSLTGTLASALLAALQPNLALALAATLSRRRAPALVLAAAVALAIAALEPFGGLRAYLALLHEHGEAERFIAIQTTIAGVARGLGTSATAAVAAGYAVSAGAVALAARQALQPRPLAQRFAIACAALPLALPFSHEHDLTIAIVPAVYAVRNGCGFAFEAAAIGTLLVATDWLGLAQRPTGVLETAAFAAAAAFAIAVLRPRDEARRRRPLLGTGTALAIVPAVVLLGFLTHPLPTWPDALGATYRAPAAWTVTQVWYDEQRRSGIAVLDPWWAGLRALSLAGCAVLWWAVLRTSPRAATASDPATEPGSSSERQPPRSAPLSTPLRPVPAERPSTSRRE